MKMNPTLPSSSSETSEKPPASLVISLDFELYWGIFDARPLGECEGVLLSAREAIPKILDLFENYDIAATWATVGYLMCESKEELFELMPTPRPAYVDAALGSHRHAECIGRDESEDPFHFAPSLVAEISRRPRQEIGTHTFSHYYCLDRGQTVQTFAADLQAALSVAARRGHRIRSIVFPRNQFNQEYLDVCRRHGLWAVRGNPLTPWHRGADHGAYNSLFCKAGRLLDAYLPLNGTRRLQQGVSAGPLPVNIPATRFLRPYSPSFRLFESRRVQLIKAELSAAAHDGGLCHLWWHPHNFGSHRAENLEVLEEILEHFDGLRKSRSMQSRTMMGLAKELKGILPFQERSPIQDWAAVISS